MRSPDRSLSYLALLLMALAAGAVRLDAEAPAGSDPAIASDLVWSGCGEGAVREMAFCQRDRALALSEP